MSTVVGVDQRREDVTRPRRAWWGLARHAFRFGRTRLGFWLTLGIVVVAAAGPYVAPNSPTEFVGRPFSGASSAAWLGTDYLGRDVLSRVLSGGRTVVWMSVVAAVGGLLLGTAIGMLAGYVGRWVDTVLMRAVDVVLAFPQIVLALLFVSMLGPRLWLIVAIVAVSHAPRFARLSRGLTVEIAGREFVQAAEVLGLPRRRILAREVLPNLATPLMIEFGLRLTWSIAIIAGLSFLGFGIQPPSADWGLMVNENRLGLAIQPLAVIAPIALVAIYTIGTNLMTEGLARAIRGVDREDETA
jgi:peptide/nickel transport system permease protein